MNSFIELAYDHGVRTALQEAGITKTARWTPAMEASWERLDDMINTPGSESGGMTPRQIAQWEYLEGKRDAHNSLYRKAPGAKAQSRVALGRLSNPMSLGEVPGSLLYSDIRATTEHGLRPMGTPKQQLASARRLQDLRDTLGQDHYTRPEPVRESPTPAPEDKAKAKAKAKPAPANVDRPRGMSGKGKAGLAAAGLGLLGLGGYALTKDED